MEELENEISTQAEENTVSLASAQALADALTKIEAYTPTTWVDNSSPDIDAEHLNKPEQAIKRVTDALNSAVDVIKDLQSQVTKNSGAISDVNNNLSNTNSRLDTSLSSSVLDYALTLPEGMHTVRFPGDGYTGADTPNSYYRYSSATIIVRSKGKIVTVLLYGISTKAPLAVNSYDGGKWNGWDQYVTKNDLLISASGTGPTDWTALETVENMPFKIWNVTKASTSKGAPAGCYDYGTLIALVATATGDRWRNTLIYLPDNNNNVGNKVYVRSGISTKWLAISGTDVNSVS